MGKAVGWLWILLLVPIWAGCSVVKLAAGEGGTPLDAVRPGATRAEVEAVLGVPLREWESPGVRYAIYEYDAGRPPNMADAFAALFMDVATAGVFELFAPSILGKHYGRLTARLILSYDPSDFVLGVFDEFDELPPDGRSPSQKPAP